MTDFSYQLYSSRNFGPLEDTLKMLGDLGYVGVEGYGALFDGLTDVSRLRGQLDEAGLVMRSGHFGLDLVEGQPDRVKELAQALGIEQIYLPFLAPDARPDDAAGWDAFGERLARAAVPLNEAGLAVGWHNHDFEFRALPDGSLPIDRILGDGALGLEFDVAWAVVAGADPMATISRHGSRITAAHVKDRAPEGRNADEDGWADVGDGVIAWPALLEALKGAGCSNFAVEHDNPSDDARFARASLQHLQSL